MLRMFRFMTGANQYRILASSHEDAVQAACEALQPNEDARLLIINTMYDEAEAAKFVAYQEYEERRKNILPLPIGIIERRSAERSQLA